MLTCFIESVCFGTFGAFSWFTWSFALLPGPLQFTGACPRAHFFFTARPRLHHSSKQASKQTRIRDLLHLSSSLLFPLWAPSQRELLLDKNALLPRGVGVNRELRTQKPRCIRPVPRAPPTRLRRLALRDIRTGSRQISSGKEMDVWRGGVS